MKRILCAYYKGFVGYQRTFCLKHDHQKVLECYINNVFCRQSSIYSVNNKAKYTTHAASKIVLKNESSDAVDDVPEENLWNSLKPEAGEKVALLVAYCGEKYHGVMMNKGDRQYPTIEKEFLRSLVKAKLIPTSCWDNPHLMRFVIASRTDKGVSAFGQIFSLYLDLDKDPIHLINQQLPKDIRVIALKRTTPSFSAWRYASSRVYSYTMPTYAFADPTHINNEYRISPDKLAHVRSIAYRYKGSHSFHNFTVGIRMKQAQAIRKIFQFDVGEPFVHQSVEFITLRLLGQSFVLHQIRMMIGLMIALVSGRASEDVFVRAFSEDHLLLPIAPGSGLLLEKIAYDGYKNKQYEKLDFSDFQKEIEDFHEKEIRPSVFRKEIEEENMMGFLDSLNCHDFNAKSYGEAETDLLKPDVEAVVRWNDDCCETNISDHVKLTTIQSRSNSNSVIKTDDNFMNQSNQ